MAAFIEDVLFGLQPSCNESDPRAFTEEIAKRIQTNCQTCVYRDDLHVFEIYRVLSLEKNDYQIRISVGQDGKSLAVSAREVSGKCRARIGSRHSQILTVKQLIRNQYEKTDESAYYLKNGDIVMVVRWIINTSKDCLKDILKFYAMIINKNLHKFHRFMSRSNVSFDYETMPEYQEDLVLTQAISTTSAYFNVSEEKSQFKMAQDTFAKQLNGLENVAREIREQRFLQNQYQSLFQVNKMQSSSSWLKINLLDYFSSLHRKGKKLLAAKHSERKIQDFLFNIIKVEIKDKIPTPIGQGGSSFIYLAKAFMTYINSVDFSSYKKKDERCEKLMVIKALKPEHEKKLQAKLHHEKQIVSKLKGSCSMYIPKYYGTQKNSDLNSVLLMQHIYGIELDRYLIQRTLTVSLWTKICILINIIHGLRHLLHYDIVHLDIKPINIIVTKNLITKILDFGEAYHKDVCPKDYCPGYTFPYVAPECFKRYEAQRNRLPLHEFSFNQKQDVFAFGMLMYEMLFNKALFHLSPLKQSQMYLKDLMPLRMFFNFESLPAYGDDAIISTLLLITFRCLSLDPSCRPKFDWIGVSLKLILNSYISH